MTIEKFEDIIAWQKARILVKEIYNSFKNCQDYAFRNQIQRAAISIMNNIAEGFERKSDSEFRYFLFISKGSCGEVRSMLYPAIDLKYLSIEEVKKLCVLCLEISKLISGLIKTLKWSLESIIATLERDFRLYGLIDFMTFDFFK